LSHSLSGNLKDFSLPDIFHIISQDGKSGRLYLSKNDRDGYVIFKHGQIISAGTSLENLKSMIFKYLLYIKKYKENEVNELNILCGESYSHLFNQLLDKKYLSLKELAIIIETGIEDIICSLFNFQDGSFKFEMIPNVDTYQFAGYSISTDAITLEAAKRIDEWDNIFKTITKESVFVCAPSHKATVTASIISPLEDFSLYLSSLLDGTYSTNSLCFESFFSEYQVYTALYELFSEKKIVRIPQKISTTSNIAYKSSREVKSTEIIKSGVIGLIFIIALFFIVYIFIYKNLFAARNRESSLIKYEYIQLQNIEKSRNSVLLYHALYGKPPSSLNECVYMKFIGKRDIVFVSPDSYQFTVYNGR